VQRGIWVPTQHALWDQGKHSSTWPLPSKAAGFRYIPSEQTANRTPVPTALIFARVCGATVTYQFPFFHARDLTTAACFSSIHNLPKATIDLEPISYRGELLRALLHAIVLVYVFLNSLLNVLVQIANEMGSQKKS
jgi:hypothetical protein